MSLANFCGYDISHDSYCVLKGSSSPTIKTYPRTIGGIIEESGVIDKSISLKSYVIPPRNVTKRKDIENYMHELNELIGTLEGDLIVNGNTYPNANVRNITYDPHLVNNFIQFAIEFVLGDQTTDSSIRQLTVPDLQGFSRGRKATFRTQLDDLSYRTFTFWHNVDLVKNYETQITIKHSKQFGGAASIIKVGGFEKIVVPAWILGPEINTRRNLEAYFYNIINGPLGRIGTLVVDGQQTIDKCFFSDFSMEETLGTGIKYTLTFIASLQC